MNLKTFLLQRATQNEIVALCLYWFVKVEIKDIKILNTSSSNSALYSASQKTASSSNLNNLSNNDNANNQNTNDQSRSNFQIFMDELLDSLRNVSIFWVIN